MRTIRLNTSARLMLLGGTALAALLPAPALAAAPDDDAVASAEAVASAQPVPEAMPAEEEDSEAQGNEMIVTARRRSERLIDVPIAITAFSGEQLETQGALDLTDIGETTPNVTIEASRGTNSTLTAFIRGVGQQDPVAGFEAGVGLYLDDVYLNRPQAALLDIYDVERIEVLRGPQGTLYGRNTIGGAIKYVTRRLAEDATFRVRGTVGSYSQADLIVSGSVPLGSPELRLGGAFARLSRDGFGQNLTTGQANYNRDIYAGRVSLEAEPSSQAYFRFSGDYTLDESNARGGHRLIPGLFSGAPVLDNEFDSRGGLLDPKQEVEAYGGSFYAQVEPAEGVTLRSITAWREDNSGTPIDFDALPAVDVDVPAIYENDQISQEVQLLVDSGPFNALVGLYYLNASSRTVFDVRLPNGVTALTSGTVQTDTYAVFGDFNYDLSPQFTVNLGGRFTWDQRASTILRRTFLGGGSPFFNGQGILFATTSDFAGTADFEEFTPRASITFRPQDDMTIYASYSRGFKGGGFDPRGQTSACRTPAGATCTPQQIYDFIAFDPETVDSYELGWRASLFDRRLTFSLVGFYADYQDVQVPGSIGTTVNGQQTFIGITTNAGAASFKGIEFEGNAILARDFGSAGDTLNFAFSLGYLDAQYDEFIDSRGIDVADNRAIQNTPDVTASGTLTYVVPVGGGMLTVLGSASYRGDSQQFELAIAPLDQEAYALFDASLVWRSDDDRWTVGLHGKNLADERYITAGYNFLSQNPDTGAFNRNAQGNFIPTLGREGILTAYYGNPRQVFLSVGFKFR